MSPPLIQIPDKESLNRAKAEFDSQGFTKVGPILLDFHIACLTSELERLEDQHEPTSVYGCVRDSRGQVLVMNKLDKESDLLYDLARSRELIDLARLFCGKAVVPLHVESFSKPAMHSSPTPPHQDHAFYQEHFDDELAVSFWIALNDIDATRSPLQFIPCRAARLLPHSRSSSADFDLELRIAPLDEEFSTLTLERGWAVVHHSYTIHRSAANTSAKPRRALVFNYRGSTYREAIKWRP